MGPWVQLLVLKLAWPSVPFRSLLSLGTPLLSPLSPYTCISIPTAPCLSPHSHHGACSFCCSLSPACCVHPFLEQSTSPSHSVAQVGLQLPPQSPECWDYRAAPPCPGSIFGMVYVNVCCTFCLSIITQLLGPGAQLLVVLVRCGWGWVHLQNLLQS